MKRFNRVRTDLLALVVLLVLVAPSGLLAQRGGGRRGGGGRGGNSSDAGPAVIPEPVNPVMLLVQHWSELSLDTSQLRTVVAIKRGLDSTNISYLRRLDSLQDVLRKNSPQGSREAPPSGMRDLIEQTNSQIQANIAPARQTAYRLLSAGQLQKAQALEDDAEKTYQTQLKALLEPSSRRGGAPPD